MCQFFIFFWNHGFALNHVLFHILLMTRNKKKRRQKEFCNQLLLSIVKYLLQKLFMLLTIMHFIYCFSLFITRKLNLHTNNPLHVFLLVVLCGTNLPYVPCWEKIKLKNELVFKQMYKLRVMSPTKKIGWRIVKTCWFSS